MDDPISQPTEPMLQCEAPPPGPSAWPHFLRLVETRQDSKNNELGRLAQTLAEETEALRARYRSAQALLEAEQAKLRSVIHGLRDGFCTLDRDGRALQLNRAAADMLGDASLADDAQSLEVLGRLAVGRVRTAPEGARPAELLELVMSGHTVRDERAELLGADGRSMSVSLLLYPLIQGNQVTGAALAFRDTTALKRAETSRRRLAMAVEASADAIYIADEQGRIEYANPAFGRISGWDPAEAVGQCPSILQSGLTSPQLYRELWETVQSGKVWSGRLLDRRRSPARDIPYWAHTTIAPIHALEGGLAGFVAVQRDVTAAVEDEQRRDREIRAAEVRAQIAEVLLGDRALEERLEAALTALATIAELCLDGQALVSFEGPDGAKEVPLSHWRSPAAPEASEAADRLGSAPLYCAGAGTDTGRLRVPIVQGGAARGVIWLGTYDAPVLCAELDELLRLVAGIVGVAIADDLARRETERARRAALDAVEAKARFLANMSHEIRTPMNGVLGMLEMLAQTDMTAEQRDFADTAHASAASLLTVINDILDYSKIEAGKLDLEYIPFDARAIAEEVATLFTARTQTQSLELACFVPVGIHTRVVGDPTRLRQVLSNILGNAVKFTRHGEVVLRIGEEQPPPEQMTADGRVWLRFEVEDTGIGMSPDQIDRLFQPFVQADGSTTRRFGGTGLGLAICKQLVELMGGTIGAASRPEGGSRFWLVIPFERQGAETQDADPDGLQGARILAVDDNATNLAIVSHYLQSWGLPYETACDGIDALEKLRAAAAHGSPFGITLVDYQMPDMDGLQLGRAIKADPALGETRLLMLSSIGHEDAALREAGFSYSLTKPIRQSVLHDALIRLHALERLEPGAHASAPAAPLDRMQRKRLRPADPPRLKGRVLLAEDNKINQRVAVSMLGRLGIDVELADDGAQALALALTRPFDLVLMDCEMPTMDGFEATRRLRDEMPPSRGRLPVVALTANAMAGDRERCIQAGMDDYIPKPIKLDQLQETLGRWLQRAETGRTDT